MTTEEKIKLYEELHPEGKEFPKTKKPDEKPEDMERLDKKLQGFQAIKDKENQTSLENTDKDTDTTVVQFAQATDKVKVYTVNQIKCLPAEDFKKIEQEVADGKARVVN